MSSYATGPHRVKMQNCTDFTPVKFELHLKNVKSRRSSYKHSSAALKQGSNAHLTIKCKILRDGKPLEANLFKLKGQYVQLSPTPFSQ